MVLCGFQRNHTHWVQLQVMQDILFVCLLVICLSFVLLFPFAYYIASRKFLFKWYFCPLIWFSQWISNFQTTWNIFASLVSFLASVFYRWIENHFKIQAMRFEYGLRNAEISRKSINNPKNVCFVPNFWLDSICPICDMRFRLRFTHKQWKCCYECWFFAFRLHILSDELQGTITSLRNRWCRGLCNWKKNKQTYHWLIIWWKKRKTKFSELNRFTI